MENEFCWFVVAMIYKHRRGKMVYDWAANFTWLGHKLTGTGMLNYCHASVLRLLYDSVVHLSRWIPRVKINWILCWAVFLIKFKVAGKFFHSWTCWSNCKITGVFGTESIAICSVVVVFLQRKVKTYYLAWRLLNLWKEKRTIQVFLWYHKFFLTL